MAERVNVDEIVRQVLAQLASRGTRGSATLSTENQTNKHELRIDARVVSLAELEGRLAGVRQISVCKQAIITPAARDLLREKKIQVGYRIEGKKVCAGHHTLTLGVAETNVDPAPLVRLVGQAGQPIEQLARSGLVSVTDELCDLAAKGGHLGLLLTGQSAAAVCLANRQRGVRAAVGVSASSVSEAVRQIGVNLLVVDPNGRTTYELRNMVRAFAQSGERRCPAEWFARLQ